MMMYCPQCRVEYREGFYECADCHVPLVAELPPEPEPGPRPQPTDKLELVTVLEGDNPVQLSLAKAVLEDAGIPYMGKGPAFRSRSGFGLFGAAGPSWIQVSQEDEREARELLENLEEASEE